MQFKFIEIPSLPSLAWCARKKPNQNIVKVIHGPGVEVHGDWFFEGAWDGPFDGPGFAEATTCAGTGARIHNETVEFVSPTVPYRGLVTLKTSEDIFVANSIPFILAQAGVKPDTNYLDYHGDLFHNFSSGFVRKPRPLVMRNGSHVYLHIYCNIVFGKDGLQKLQKSAPKAPSSFEDYRDRLVAMLVRLRENATDPRRDKQIYQPMTTLSRGYDSVACAALGAAAGWKDAVTMVPANPTDADNEDDGTPVAECLGLMIERFYKQAWRQRTDIPEAEFVATAWGAVNVPLVGMEEKLRETLLIMGDPGDRVWQPDSVGVLPNLELPAWDPPVMVVPSIWEFLLRVNIITLYPAMFVATHWDKLRQLMTSNEMLPWSIGGDYDRPFPRRIAEEMGVPRELFGQKKMATLFDYPYNNPSVKGHKDYVRFLKEVGLLKLNKDGNFTIKFTVLMPHFFHWGIDRTMRRYIVDVPEE